MQIYNSDRDTCDIFAFLSMPRKPLINLRKLNWEFTWANLQKMIKTWGEYQFHKYYNGSIQGFFKEEVLNAQEQAVPMCRKKNRWGR